MPLSFASNIAAEHDGSKCGNKMPCPCLYQFGYSSECNTSLRQLSPCILLPAQMFEVLFTFCIVFSVLASSVHEMVPSEYCLL